jgi:hypothetical protein
LYLQYPPYIYIHIHAYSSRGQIQHYWNIIGSCNPNISLSYIKYKCFWIRFDHWFPKIQRSRIICPSSLVVFVHTTCWWRETWLFMMWTAKSISLSDAQDPHAQAASQVAASLDGREPFSRQKNEAGRIGGITWMACQVTHILCWYLYNIYTSKYTYR